MSFFAVVEALNAAGARLQRDVNPVVMTKASFTAKLAERDRFVTRVMREPKILLLGDARELGLKLASGSIARVRRGETAGTT
jgi:hypothetical protein